MSEKDIKQWCRSHYNLNGNTKIRKINMDKFQFVIRLGDCYAELPFPKSLIREIKLAEIGILN
jgi:hypothetical protein